jgi:hypothetical protein
MNFMLLGFNDDTDFSLGGYDALSSGQVVISILGKRAAFIFRV